MTLAIAPAFVLFHSSSMRLFGTLVGVGGSTASGYEVSGAIGGLIAAVVAVCGLGLTIASGKAKRRRDDSEDAIRAQERLATAIASARQAGRDETAAFTAQARADALAARVDADYWRGIAMGLISRSRSPGGEDENHT